MEEAEVENKKLRREIFLRKATLAHIENESEAVKGTLTAPSKMADLKIFRIRQ